MQLCRCCCCRCRCCSVDVFLWEVHWRLIDTTQMSTGDITSNSSPFIHEYPRRPIPAAAGRVILRMWSSSSSSSHLSLVFYTQSIHLTLNNKTILLLLCLLLSFFLSVCCALCVQQGLCVWPHASRFFFSLSKSSLWSWTTPTRPPSSSSSSSSVVPCVSRRALHIIYTCAALVCFNRDDLY